jgi:hypothetical protein
MGLFDFLRKPQVATECRGPKLAAPRSVEPHKVGATETDIERQKNKQILELVEASVIRSGCFRPEKIPQLMLALRDPPTFAQLNTKASEASNGLLSKEEKQSLGLNTRRRYSREFIEYFEPDALKTIEPIAMLSSIQSDAFHRTSRKFTLIRFKEMKVIKKITIGTLGGCKIIQHARKTYDISEVPELPMAGCDQECKCYYEAVFPK